MNVPLVALLVAVVVVGILVFLAITLTQHKKHGFDRAEYQANWLAINNSLKKESPDSANMVVVKADKLLDQALIEIGITGKTMGERLKKLHGRLSDENGVWAAHKTRNRIAHETNYSATYEDARRALSAYKTALKDLGAI
ncbi:hypothetical protein IKG48_03100 [Candidatus Saccharibacteria bacterium]|nr:hypothetical protein [Candidatus Saccharibacteria bacterium]